jgi:hypothetical protein
VNPKWVTAKKSTHRHIRTKLLKTKDNDKILKKPVEKRHNAYRGII